MKISFAYVSPSSMPSSSANSIHVAMQCAALLAEGVDLKVFANRTVRDHAEFKESVSRAYGVGLEKADLVTFHGKCKKFVNVRIALLALFKLIPEKKPTLVLSRNLYFSFFHAVVFGRSLIFETHQVEYGFRKLLQRWTMTRPWVKTIVVSKKLEEILTSEHEVSPTKAIVLPDAAPDGLTLIRKSKTRERLYQMTEVPRMNWKSVCGYFGQLYEGRGIEIIEGMARERSETLFLVYGGEPKDVAFRREVNGDLPNIFFGGHVSHPEAQELMRCVDFLLMPYQSKVSIGVKGHDTGRWMSPMKMFEYMAAGVPIISSDLAVLREVLVHEKNALLVTPSDQQEWCGALDRLSSDASLADLIGERAHQDYRERYTWGARARAILALVN
jgi:glycosyltransferase involved in cell wall biosynthesis